MTNDFFNGDADEVFKLAGVEKADAPKMYDEVKAILANKMATLSATMGMSRERLDLYDEQKQSLVTDLLDIKSAGTFR